MSHEDEPPELISAAGLRQIRRWTLVGAIVTALGLLTIYFGPKPQSIMLGVLFVLAGAGVVFWASAAHRRATLDE